MPSSTLSAAPTTLGFVSVDQTNKGSFLTFAVSVVLSRLTSCLLCVTSLFICYNGFVVWWIKASLSRHVGPLAGSVSVTL